MACDTYFDVSRSDPAGFPKSGGLEPSAPFQVVRAFLHSSAAKP